VLRAWYSRIDEYLLGLCFTKTVAYPKLYYLFDRFDFLVLVFYVDELIFTSSYEKLIAWCKIELAHMFDMKDIELMHYLLGLKV
jgi:hypothetical protein